MQRFSRKSETAGRRHGNRCEIPGEIRFLAGALVLLQAKRLRTVASQVDIAASVLGLLGVDAPHQCWGRNLFALPGGDPGFAVVKPSGGEDQVALIEGDCILINHPQTKSRLFRFCLEFPPAVTADLSLQETDRRHAMEKKLEAYVQSALQLLQRTQLGVPDGGSPVFFDHYAAAARAMGGYRQGNP